MGARLPTEVVEDGVRSRAGAAGPFEVGELTFPPGFSHAPFEPEVPYVGFVLEGAVQKRFARSVRDLAAGEVFTIPAGATHAARFSRVGARVLVVLVQPRDVPAGAAGVLRRLGAQRQARAAAVARRLAAELAGADRAWQLAAEGLALELLAALARGARPARHRERAPRWLADAVELLEPPGGATSLGDLAGIVGVHPSHLARVFRRRYGASVGEYARARRLDWAAARLAGDDTPLGVLAREAGFCDQSHFTRAFVRHTGLTPGLYRRAARADGR